MSGQFELDTTQLHNLLNRRQSPSNSTGRSSVTSSSDSDSASIRSMSIVSMTNVQAALPVSPIPPGPRTILVSAGKIEEESDNGKTEEAADQPTTATNEEEEAAKEIPLIHRQLYIDEIVWRIDDSVFVSAIDASANLSLLCRLNIGMVCVIYDHTVFETKPPKSLICPCICRQHFRHHRSTADIDVPDSEQKCINKGTDLKIQNLFSEFIELVEKEKAKDKRVLVCSTRGRNRAPAFCAAYLMCLGSISRGKAVAEVALRMKTMRPPVNISDYMQRALMRFQGQLGITPEPSDTNGQNTNGKRTSAWT